MDSRASCALAVCMKGPSNFVAGAGEDDETSSSTSLPKTSPNPGNRPQILSCGLADMSGWRGSFPKVLALHSLGSQASLNP